MGADIHKKSSRYNVTALWYLCYEPLAAEKAADGRRIARLLLDRGASINVINGNYALQAGLNAGTDALAVEDSESISAITYANILVVKEGNENAEKIQALVKAVLSQEVKDYINETYSGAVVPIF